MNKLNNQVYSYPNYLIENESEIRTAIEIYSYKKVSFLFYQFTFLESWSDEEKLCATDYAKLSQSGTVLPQVKLLLNSILDGFFIDIELNELVFWQVGNSETPKFVHNSDWQDFT